MIKLIKTAIPEILKKNAEAWTTAIIGKFAQNLQPTKGEKSRYSHPQIKSALVNETDGKCAYCESQIRHIAYGDIEHVAPKSADPTKWFEWENLTLACGVCNTNKGITSDLVDPYQEDPEQRFIFFGPAVLPVPGDTAALDTVRTLELNRDVLVGRRTERIEYLNLLATVISLAPDARTRQIMSNDFKKELRNAAEYAAMSRSVSKEYLARSLIDP
jgi:uncharacterized protein (TIGR02646 family)